MFALRRINGHGARSSRDGLTQDSLSIVLNVMLLAALLAALAWGGIRLAQAAQVEAPFGGVGILAAPVAGDDAYTTNENTQMSVTAPGVLDNDSDADGDELTAELVGDVTHGTLNLNLDGSFTYDPALDFYGSDSFTYRAYGGGEYSNTATVTITVNTVPEITEIDPVGVTMSEDGVPTAFSLTLNATDIDGDTLTWNILTPATHGTATATGTGLSKAIAYDPDADYHGSDSFVVQVSDGNGGTDSITVNVTIQPVNDSPAITEIDPVGVTMSEDGVPTAFNLTLNATDIDGDTLTWSILTPATHGTATATGTGLSKVIGYDPDADYHGSDSFVVQVSDGNGGTDSITVNVTINAENDAPVFTEIDPVGVTMSEDGTPTAFNLTLNATDAEGNTITWSILTQGLHGTATASGTGTSKVIGYTPAVNYNGSDSFVVQISDGLGGTSTITVNVTIQPVNDPPAVTEIDPVGVIMSEDGVPTAFNLTLNATDIDGDTLTWSILTPATHGTATATGTGLSKAIGYDPDADYHGSDSFVAQVSDGNGGTDSITVNVTINAENDAPVFTEIDPVGVIMSEDGTPTAFNLTLNATDAEGNTITWSILTQGLHGTATASGTGTSKVIGYTPAADYHGSDSFVVQISDGLGGTSTITVNVTIQPVNDPPAITESDPVEKTMSEDGVPTAFSLTLNANDIDGDTLTWSILTPATHGTATAAGTGLSKVIGYAPLANYNGSDSFVAQVSDGNGGTDTVTVNVTITAVNDPPVAVDDHPAAILEDSTSNLIIVLDNDTDAELDELFVAPGTVISPPSGTLAPDLNNKTFHYTPAPDVNGQVTFQYKAFDGTAYSANYATVTITITPTNDLPAPVNDTVSVPEESPNYVINVLANDSFGGDGPGTDPLAITVGPLHGTANVNNNGTPSNPVDDTIRYTPSLDYNGADSLTYQICDSALYHPKNCVTALVTINVTPVNDAPVGYPDNYTLNTKTGSGDEKKTLSAHASRNLLINDVDPDNALEAVKVSNPSHGTVTVNEDGTFTYITDNAAYNGQVDTFTYWAAEDGGSLHTAPVTVTIIIDLVPPAVAPVWVDPPPNEKAPYLTYSEGTIDLVASVASLPSDFAYLEFLRYDYMPQPKWETIDVLTEEPWETSVPVTDLRWELNPDDPNPEYMGVNELGLRLYDVNGNYTKNIQRLLVKRLFEGDFWIYLPAIQK